MPRMQSLNAFRRSVGYATVAAVLAFSTCVSAGAVAHAGFAIVPTFDSSITGDSNAAAIESTINSAISIYENDFSDPITVNIKFQEMSGGLGASTTGLFTTTYSNYLIHLTADAKTTNDAVAVAHLPAGPDDPVGPAMNSTIYLTKATGDAVGIANNANVQGFNGIVALNTSITNPGSPGSSNAYSLMAVTEHEIDEVLGLGSGLNGNFPIRPEDLFRFTSAGARTYTTSGDDAYFSIDGGTTDLARFNQQGGADYGDWWTAGTHTPRVQDAFATPGANPPLGVELTALDVIGFDLVTQAVVPEPTSLAFWMLAITLAGGAGCRTFATSADRRP